MERHVDHISAGVSLRSVVRDLLEADEAFLVLRPPLRLHVPVPALAETSVVTHAQGRAFDDLHEHVVLVPPFTHELEVTWVLRVADSLQDHVVALLEGNVTDILHGLDERDDFAESLLRGVLVVARDRVLVVDVVARPEVLAEHPGDDELREAAVPEGLISEKAGALLLGIVAVAEHGGVGIVVEDAAALRLLLLRAKPSDDSIYVSVCWADSDSTSRVHLPFEHRHY